jgi:hypothetical protein
MEPMSIIGTGFFIAYNAACIAGGILIREEVYQALSGEHVSEYEKRKEEEEKNKDSEDTKD